MDAAPPPAHESSSILHFSPRSYSSSSSVVGIIAIVGIIATSIVLVSYYVFVIKCCLNWQRIALLRRFYPSGRRSSGDDLTTVYAPTAVSGLDESLIRLIPVIRFRKEAEGKRNEEEAEYIECAVCLSEFMEGEKLRVIPNCCHAFHIDCIDIWLQDNANCPLCRSSISSNTLSSIDRILKNSNLVSQDPCESANLDRFTGNDGDFVVIEIQGSDLAETRSVRSDIRDLSARPSPLMPKIRKHDLAKKEKGSRKIQHVLSMDDECINVRGEDGEFHRVEPIRRSISMDLSSHRQLCSEIQDVLGQRNSAIQSIICGEVSSNGENSSSSSNSRGIRRSFFSFGNARVRLKRATSS